MKPIDLNQPSHKALSQGINKNPIVGEAGLDASRVTGFKTALDAIEYLKSQVQDSVRKGTEEALKARFAILSKLQNYNPGDSIEVTIDPDGSNTKVYRGKFESFSFDNLDQLHLHYKDNQGTSRSINIDHLSANFKPKYLEVHQDRDRMEQTTVKIASRKEEFTEEDFIPPGGFAVPEEYPNPPNFYYEERDSDGFGTMEYEYFEDPTDDLTSYNPINSVDDSDIDFDGAFDGVVSSDYVPYQERIIVIKNLDHKE